MGGGMVGVGGHPLSVCGLSELTAGDTLVWVGPALMASVPWTALGRAGVRRVYYDSDPLDPGLYESRVHLRQASAAQEIFKAKFMLLRDVPNSSLGAPISPGMRLPIDEVWHYSHANEAALSKACAATPGFCEHVTQRYVPPGNHGWPGGRRSRDLQLVHLGKSVVFVGDIGLRTRRPCLEELDKLLGTRYKPTHNRSELLSSEVVMEALDTMRHLNSRYDTSGLVHFNMHKQCTSRLSDLLPLESARLSKALSLGRLVLSQRANSQDEAEFDGIVSFVGTRPSEATHEGSSTDGTERSATAGDGIGKARAADFAASLEQGFDDLVALNTSARVQLRVERSAAFRARFDPARIFRRAGLPRLFEGIKCGGHHGHGRLSY